MPGLKEILVSASYILDLYSDTQFFAIAIYIFILAIISHVLSVSSRLHATPLQIKSVCLPQHLIRADMKWQNDTLPFYIS